MDWDAQSDFSGIQQALGSTDLHRSVHIADHLFLDHVHGLLYDCGLNHERILRPTYGERGWRNTVRVLRYHRVRCSSFYAHQALPQVLSSHQHPPHILLHALLQVFTFRLQVICCDQHAVFRDLTVCLDGAQAGDTGSEVMEIRPVVRTQHEAA